MVLDHNKLIPNICVLLSFRVPSMKKYGRTHHNGLLKIIWFCLAPEYSGWNRSTSDCLCTVSYFQFIGSNHISTLRPRQNGHHYTDVILNYISFNENVLIQIKISLKIGPWGPIDNMPALVQMMTWRRTSDKSLSEPMTALDYWRIHVSLRLNVNFAVSMGPCLRYGSISTIRASSIVRNIRKCILHTCLIYHPWPL